MNSSATCLLHGTVRWTLSRGSRTFSLVFGRPARSSRFAPGRNPPGPRVERVFRQGPPVDLPKKIGRAHPDREFLHARNRIVELFVPLRYLLASSSIDLEDRVHELLDRPDAWRGPSPGFVVTDHARGHPHESREVRLGDPKLLPPLPHRVARGF